jgi:hypothetical protein
MSVTNGGESKSINENLGVTWTRLNIVGLQSWAAPIKSGQLQRRRGGGRGRENRKLRVSKRDTKQLLTQKKPPKKLKKTHPKKPTKNVFLFCFFFNFEIFMKILQTFLFQTDFFMNK